MTGREAEEQPAIVFGDSGTKQAGEVRARWAWTEPSVWTKRMLTTLERGVKGGQWFSLIDKVYADANLRAAFKRVRRNKGGAGVDHVTTERFENRLEEHLQDLQHHLKANTYRPHAVKRTWIPKPGSKEKRPLGIPTVRDRVAQSALRNVLEPIFEIEFAEHSYGFRPGRGCKDALRRVQDLLDRGYRHVVDADLKGYFDTIPHDRLMQCLERRVSDGRILGLIQAYLNQDILDGLERWTPERGSPQGAVISPLLSNVYLNPLDHLMAEKGIEMVRYADDFVILCRTADEAQAALQHVQAWVEEAELTLHPEKTHIVDINQDETFVFLGYRFGRKYKFPSAKSRKKLYDAIRAKTKRTNGYCLERIIADLNPILRGWFEYFKHAYKTTFESIDGWIRGRLRSILRKRRKRKGKAKGKDHHRWPNAYFIGRGLFTLAHAYDEHVNP